MVTKGFESDARSCFRLVASVQSLVYVDWQWLKRELTVASAALGGWRLIPQVHDRLTICYELGTWRLAVDSQVHHRLTICCELGGWRSTPKFITDWQSVMNLVVGGRPPSS